MTRFAISFMAGLVPVICVAIALGLVMSIMADSSGWADTELRLGPLGIWSYEVSDTGSATFFGSGIVAIGVLAGLANVVGATVLRRRDGQSSVGTT